MEEGFYWGYPAPGQFGRSEKVYTNGKLVDRYLRLEEHILVHISGTEPFLRLKILDERIKLKVRFERFDGPLKPPK